MSEVGRLGPTLRRLRRASNLTLEHAARNAEVTKGYLSKIELGGAMPSIAVVSRLADVYGVPFSDVFAPPGEKGAISLVRASDRVTINRNGSELGYIYEVASLNKADPRAEIFFLTLPCLGGEGLPKYRHSGEEIILMLEGRMRFNFAGTDFVLDPGDCIQFNASIEHYGVAIEGRDAKAFVVIIPDRRPDR